LPAPYVFDGSYRAVCAGVAGYAAKRYVDMLYVTGLDRATADRHFRQPMPSVPGGLSEPADTTKAQARIAAAWRDGRITVHADAADRRVTVRWNDPDFATPIAAHAIARPGYGGILLGPHATPEFDPIPLARPVADPNRPWPLGDAVNAPPPPAKPLAAAADALFANSPGIYGLLIARADRITFERYSAHGAPDRATPSWSMTKSITGTLIGRLVHEGWLGSVYDAAPAPLWRDPRAIHSLITIDHLLRMRSGLAMPVLDAAGGSALGFEVGMVYHLAADAFTVAQRGLVATRPGAVFRYVNSGPNVLGAIIRDAIERRGLPYYATLYGLLADRIGMASYQHSADLKGNLIASGAGFATLRDYARLGVLYVQDGIWDNQRLLPTGWVDYALAPSHAGTNYAASFWTNNTDTFPSLPADTAWASGASDQRIFIMRSRGMVAAVANETDHPMDLPALDRTLAVASE
jgi:CubicO group peptidase (beta-lactamase class C family)